MATRTRLYHKDKPEGKIFLSPEAVKIAKENDWKESPWLKNENEENTKETKSTALEIDIDGDGEADIIIPKGKRKSKG